MLIDVYRMYIREEKTNLRPFNLLQLAEIEEKDRADVCIINIIQLYV
jgi:hypothetical protein